jgi:hypothetical protein
LRPACGDWSRSVSGLLFGFTSFLVNAGAPPFHVYMLPQKLPPQRYAGVHPFKWNQLNDKMML